jgi:hypothetical protein
MSQVFIRLHAVIIHKTTIWTNTAVCQTSVYKSTLCHEHPLTRLRAVTMQKITNWTMAAWKCVGLLGLLSGVRVTGKGSCQLESINAQVTNTWNFTSRTPFMTLFWGLEVNICSVFIRLCPSLQGMVGADWQEFHSWQEQDCWTELTGFSWTFSIVRHSKKHDVSETGSVSVLRWRWGEDTYSVGPLRES